MRNCTKSVSAMATLQAIGMSSWQFRDLGHSKLEEILNPHAVSDTS